MPRRSPLRFRPSLERVEERVALSAGPLASHAAAMAHLALQAELHAASAQAHMVAIQNHHPRAHRPQHHPMPGCGCGGGGTVGNPGGLPFNCARIGIYNFAVVTITNRATVPVTFQIFASPCPNGWQSSTLQPGQSNWYYTHFPSSGFNPMFQVNLGGLNSYVPTPNIIPQQRYPNFVYQITPAMGSQYQIVQTSPGHFALKPATSI